ncbi:MAG: hypothetical protein WBD20_15395 [Pirellulaceae bacterium]
MESTQCEVRIQRRRLAMLCLAASSLAWQMPAASAENAGSFLLPPVTQDEMADVESERFLIPSERKFIRISEQLRSLPDSEDDEDRPRLRRFNPDDDAESASDRLSNDTSRDDEEKQDDDMSSALTRQRITQLEDGRFGLPPLAAPNTATDTVGNGRIPEGSREGVLAPTVPLAESGQDRNLEAKPWAWTVSHWAAANTFSNPRYFEDRMLERHGHERFPKLQPFASGARFFATVPMLPYLMTISHPCDCESTLGYYRPGSCAPVLHQQPPWDTKAALVEAAAVTAGVVVIP